MMKSHSFLWIFEMNVIFRNLSCWWEKRHWQMTSNLSVCVCVCFFVFEIPKSKSVHIQKWNKKKFLNDINHVRAQPFHQFNVAKKSYFFKRKSIQPNTRVWLNWFELNSFFSISLFSFAKNVFSSPEFNFKSFKVFLWCRWKKILIGFLDKHFFHPGYFWIADSYPVSVLAIRRNEFVLIFCFVLICWYIWCWRLTKIETKNFW